MPSHAFTMLTTGLESINRWEDGTPSTANWATVITIADLPSAVGESYSRLEASLHAVSVHHVGTSVM